MTQHYIGVKQVVAWPEPREGVDGYAVKYPDGYVSWSPKDVFEASYLPMGEDNDGSKITDAMVTDFGVKSEVGRMGNHTVALTTHRNGFTTVTDSACVDPANYDEEIGIRFALAKAKNQVWGHLGFVLAWARNGIAKADPYPGEGETTG